MLFFGKAAITGCGVVEMNSAALQTEAADGSWGGADSGDGYRADVMRGMRADVREEKAAISRIAADAAAKLSGGQR